MLSEVKRLWARALVSALCVAATACSVPASGVARGGKSERQPIALERDARGDPKLAERVAVFAAYRAFDEHEAAERIAQWANLTQAKSLRAFYELREELYFAPVDVLRVHAAFHDVFRRLALAYIRVSSGSPADAQQATQTLLRALNHALLAAPVQPSVVSEGRRPNAVSTWLNDPKNLFATFTRLWEARHREEAFELLLTASDESCREPHPDELQQVESAAHAKTLATMVDGVTLSRDVLGFGGGLTVARIDIVSGETSELQPWRNAYATFSQHFIQRFGQESRRHCMSDSVFTTLLELKLPDPTGIWVVQNQRREIQAVAKVLDHAALRRYHEKNSEEAFVASLSQHRRRSFYAKALALKSDAPERLDASDFVYVESLCSLGGGAGKVMLRHLQEEAADRKDLILVSAPEAIGWYARFMPHIRFLGETNASEHKLWELWKDSDGFLGFSFPYGQGGELAASLSFHATELGAGR